MERFSNTLLRHDRVVRHVLPCRQIGKILQKSCPVFTLYSRSSNFILLALRAYALYKPAIILRAGIYSFENRRVLDAPFWVKRRDNFSLSRHLTFVHRICSFTVTTSHQNSYVLVPFIYTRKNVEQVVLTFCNPRKKYMDLTDDGELQDLCKSLHQPLEIYRYSNYFRRPIGSWNP